MKYNHTVTTNVTPFLFSKLSESDAQNVRAVFVDFKKNNMERGVNILDSFLTEENLLVLVSGNVGNTLDMIIEMIKEKGIDVIIANDPQATNIINSSDFIEYPNITKELASNWD